MEIQLKRVYLELPKNISFEKLSEEIIKDFLIGSTIGDLGWIVLNEFVWPSMIEKNLDNGDKITIEKRQISFSEFGKIKKFKISELKDLKFHFTDSVGQLSMANIHTDSFSRIEFKHNQESYKIHYLLSQEKANATFRSIYKESIKFKEYRNGRRVFMGKQPNYSEVQRLKKKYGIDWI